MAYISKSFRVCDRCKLEEESHGEVDSETGWAELKFTYVSERWHLCPACIIDFLHKFIPNEAVLPVKTIRRSN